MLGNGLGSHDIVDNDKFKSVTAAVHIKPAEHLRIGTSYYSDVISQGAHIHHRPILKKVNQHLFTGSVAYFGKRFEVLTEGTLGTNKTDSTGKKKTSAGYFYGGVKFKKWTPYFRADGVRYQAGELFYSKNNAWGFLLGVRYQINYLAVIKLELLRQDFEKTGTSDKATLQVAIGF
jgi:hypothetical protein